MSKSPVLMIHGAFCGPWSLDGLKQKFEAAGYAVTAPPLRFHDEKRSSPALATTGLADYAADLEDEIAGPVAKAPEPESKFRKIIDQVFGEETPAVKRPKR